MFPPCHCKMCRTAKNVLKIATFSLHFLGNLSRGGGQLKCFACEVGGQNPLALTVHGKISISVVRFGYNGTSHTNCLTKLRHPYLETDPKN